MTDMGPEMGAMGVENVEDALLGPVGDELGAEVAEWLG
jgi:hypothetical protein